jgi:membrane protease YdiL (CAAX protease family)
MMTGLMTERMKEDMDISMGNEITGLKRAGTPSYREQLFEVLTFCFLILPGLAFSFTAGPALKENFLLGVVGVMLSDLALVTLVCFFLWHNGEKFAGIGWILKGYQKEIVLGVLLYFPLVYGLSFVEELLQSAGLVSTKGHIPSFLEPVGTIQQIVATLMILIVAVSEETIFRGYLILRLKSITRSPFAAVIISSIIFSVGHGYEGLAGVIIVGIMGTSFAVIYLWRKSLMAPIVMHFMQDFVAIVLVSRMADK